MIRPRRHQNGLLRTGAPLLAVGVACAACSGGPSPLTLSAIGLPGESPKFQIPALHEPSVFEFGSTEAYARIARGANACWFGAAGRLKATHALHADAAPTMNGGAVEILVHERVPDQPRPWVGYKTFRIALDETKGLDGSPGGGATHVHVENLRMPEDEAKRMRAEVFKWAAGSDACDPATIVPQPAAATMAPTKPKTSPRKTTNKPAVGGSEASVAPGPSSKPAPGQASSTPPKPE